MRRVTGVSDVLFDLDGTLLDTAGELVAAVNRAVAPLTGGVPLDFDLVKSWIGNGIVVLFRSALGHLGFENDDLENQFDLRWGDFLSAYHALCGTRCAPYPGMDSCLQHLRRAGCRLGVVTNKDSVFTRKLLLAHELAGQFEVVICGDTLAQKKPAPQTLWAALQQLHVEPGQGLFVGDSITDLKTGAAAGVRTWAVRHGYHHGDFDRPLPAHLRPDRFVDGFPEIAALLT